VKLRRLEIENFRQFYGKQELSFSTDKKKNVTLIYGSNGAGKTTILNAFTWGLYGRTTPGLSDASWLVNNLAWNEAETGKTVTARVALEFEDKDHRYELTRVQSARKEQDGSRSMIEDGRLELYVTDSTGRNEPSNHPVGAIGGILPERLHRFVFFDGERDIEHLANPDATAEIKDAIKTVLGLEVFERAIEHTEIARKRELNPELSSLGGDEDQQLTAEIDRLTDERDRSEGELQQLKDNLAAQRSELDRVNERLAKTEAAAELQARRQQIETAMAAAETRSREADHGLDDAIRRSGFLAFTPKLAEAVSSRAEELHDRGEIPAPIKQPFVQELLDRGICICGSELKEGTDQHAAVLGWFEKAGLEDVEAGWGRVDGAVLTFQSRRDELYRYLLETIREKEGHEREYQVWDERRSEIEEDIDEVDDAEVQELNTKRSALRGKIDGLLRQSGAMEMKISELSSQLAEKESELEKAEQRSEKAALAAQRVKVAHEAQQLCEALLEVRTEQTRADLDDRLKRVFGEMCFKPYVPALTEDFRLTIAATLGGSELPVATSTGESQILALSFVGAMAELARTRFEESQAKSGSDILSFQGGVFPLVLDAVFGTLDDTYQEGVAKALPELAPQVIVMVTRGSAPGAIHDQLWPRTGKVAVCSLHTSAPDAEEAKVEIPNGEAAPYRVRCGQDEDRCEIVEV
jgi:DNA sulfur modification protein DndD